MSRFCASPLVLPAEGHPRDGWGATGRLQVAMPDPWNWTQLQLWVYIQIPPTKSFVSLGTLHTSLGHTSLNSKTGGVVVITSKGKDTQNGAHPSTRITGGSPSSLASLQCCGHWTNPHKTEGQYWKGCDDSIQTKKDLGSHAMGEAKKCHRIGINVSTVLCFKSPFHKHVYANNLWLKKKNLFYWLLGKQKPTQKKIELDLKLMDSPAASGTTKPSALFPSDTSLESIPSSPRVTARCWAGPHLFTIPSITWTTCSSLSAGTRSANEMSHRYKKMYLMSIF